MTGFANVPVDRVSQGGGVIGILVSDAATQATSTPTPCRECYISYCPSIITTNQLVHFAIGTSLTVSLGACLPKSGVSDSLGPGSAGALRVPIDDVSKLWFWGTAANCKVGITYRT